MSWGKSWMQPGLFPALDDLEHAEAERVIQLAWSQAWRRPWWRSPMAIKTVVLFAVQTAPLIAALIILPLHFFLLFIGAEWVLSILFGDFFQQLMFRRDVAGCIDRVLAAEHAVDDTLDAEPVGSDGGPFISLVRLLLPAVRGQSVLEVIRVTNEASSCIKLRKPIRTSTAVKILINVTVGGILLIVIDRVTRNRTSPNVHSIISYSSLLIWMAIGARIFLGELNFHAERIIAEETDGVDATTGDG